MENEKEEKNVRRKLKRSLFLIAVAVVFGIAVLFARGAYVSDTLKGLVVPELESMTGQRVVIGRIHVNLFPVYADAREISVLDRAGAPILLTKRVKGYVDLTGLLSKRLIIRRLVINEPKISADRQKIEEIERNVRTYLEDERESAVKVKLRVIEVVKGDVLLTENDSKARANIRGLQGEVILGENPRVKGSIRELVVEKEGWPKIVCDIKTVIALKGERIEVQRLEVGSYGSRFAGEGFYSKGQGLLKTRLTLLVDSVKRLFGLRRSGEGRISVKGEVRLEGEEKRPAIHSDRPGPRLRLQEDKPRLPGLKDIVVELNLGGVFRIETLMELLKVKERIDGLVDFEGNITGRLADFTGKGKARLRKGNLFSVDVDSLACNVFYRNGVLNFEKGDAKLYHGTAQADASISLPVVDSFTVDVKFQSVDSKSAFKLIGWDPGIPAGKVDGDLYTSGPEFSPRGVFDYRALSVQQRSGMKGYRLTVDDFLNRVKSVKGNYSLADDVISLSNLLLSTSQSSVHANGTVDLARKALSLKSRLLSENVADLALPYYAGIRGRGEFSGDVTGTFDNPRLSGGAVISNAEIEGYHFDSFTLGFSYQKNLLEIREAVIRSAGEEHRARGKIAFPHAKDLFALTRPVYDLSASLRNAEFGRFGRIFDEDFSAKGRLSGEVKIGGKDMDIAISGHASIEEGSVYGVTFDSSAADVSYAIGDLSVRRGRVTKGKSVLALEGKIGTGKKFSYRASSERLFLKDFLPDRIFVPEDIVVKAQSEGQGTFENPAITVNAGIIGGTYKGRSLGGGTIRASIQNHEILVNAGLFDGKMSLKGKGYLNDTLPWSAELSIRPGRYAVLISSFMKDVPEDLQFNIEGRAEMKGNRKNIAASVHIDRLSLSLFGQTFTNGSDIRLTVENKKFSFQEFAIKSGAASFKLRGGVEIGKQYDLDLAGSASLAPLKTLSKKIGYLKGEADFTLAVKGRWETPELTGSMNLSNASFGLRDYPTYISAIRGSLFMEQDRIVLKGLTGKVGGGDVSLSGVCYMSGFHIKRFYLEAKLAGVTAELVKDFRVNFDGDLLYKGTAEDMGISGDIKINRARYREPLEWRSWIFASKGIERPKTELSVFERAGLNVSIKGSENISIDNNIARAPVKIAGEMLVKGSVSNPVLFGRIEATEGYVYFRNNEFKIISVSVDLVDPNRIKPIVNLVAETTVQGYRIRLNLEGEMERFSLALSSQPHLEDRDILALLTSGQIGTQLKGIEGGIGAGEATSFLTGKIQDVVEERLRTIAGVDRFQVEPYVSTTSGTVGPRVTVSKRLIGEKLFVTYANLLGTTEEQVIKVEYFLSKRVSLIGVRDEKGSLGGDVRFRFEFK